MQLYDATNKDGLCQEVDRLCDTNDTSYSRLDKTVRINTALETVVGWLINADGTWQFDDDNYSTNPIGTSNLTSGQISYSFSDKFLDLLEIDILDLQGVYRRIEPFDASEAGVSFEEYFNHNSTGAPIGFPTHYDKLGNSIRLSHQPTSANVTLTAGLKVKFKRTAYLFTLSSATTEDTAVPGFASPYHVILAYMASIPYCMTYKKDRVALYEKAVTEMKKDLTKFYSRREKDKRKQATTAGISHR